MYEILLKMQKFKEIKLWLHLIFYNIVYENIITIGL